MVPDRARRDVQANPYLSQNVLLDVARLRRRRPIHDKPSGYLRFAALVTKPGEKCGPIAGKRNGSSPSCERQSTVALTMVL